MIIDILSDLHLDFYFPAKLKIVDIDAVKSIFHPILTDNKKRDVGDVLVIAGDIGHYNDQNIQVLKILQQEYYKHIVCVLGNHDYYLLNYDIKQQYQFNSFNRAKEMKNLINSCENMYCLDGDVVEIDGVKFGGAMGWYSDAYIKAYYVFKSRKSVISDWKDYSMDSEHIYGIENYDDIYKLEYPKLKNIYQKCDVMITHINPSFKHEHINSAYHNQTANAFFTFNGHDLIANGTMKYWIFGHTHDDIEYELYDKKVICNPLGYPAENGNTEWVWIKSIEIKKEELNR